jgi:hypothetical protein
MEYNSIIKLVNPEYEAIQSNYGPDTPYIQSQYFATPVLTHTNSPCYLASPIPFMDTPNITHSNSPNYEKIQVEWITGRAVKYNIFNN